MSLQEATLPILSPSVIFPFIWNGNFSLQAMYYLSHINHIFLAMPLLPAVPLTICSINCCTTAGLSAQQHPHLWQPSDCRQNATQPCCQLLHQLHALTEFADLLFKKKQQTQRFHRHKQNSNDAPPELWFHRQRHRAATSLEDNALSIQHNWMHYLV